MAKGEQHEKGSSENGIALALTLAVSYTVCAVLYALAPGEAGHNLA
jgi:hypothetical protein